MKCQGQMIFGLPPFSIGNLETHFCDQRLLVLVTERVLYDIHAMLISERYSEAVFLYSCDSLFPKQAIALSEMINLNPLPQYSMIPANRDKPTVQITQPFDRTVTLLYKD